MGDNNEVSWVDMQESMSSHSVHTSRLTLLGADNEPQVESTEPALVDEGGPYVALVTGLPLGTDRM